MAAEFIETRARGVLTASGLLGVPVDVVSAAHKLGIEIVQGTFGDPTYAGAIVKRDNGSALI